MGLRSKIKNKSTAPQKIKTKTCQADTEKSQVQSSSFRRFQEGFAGGAPAPQNFAGGKGMGVSSYPQ